MKRVSVTVLLVGTRFAWKGDDYEIVDRDGYPFIAAKCLSKPSVYDMLFCNFEQVDVDEWVKVYKQTFVDDGHHGFVMKEELV